MRRHYYRQQYQVPKELKPQKKKRSHPLVQPNWDDTIHDLSDLKLSPEEQLRRRLSRISKNQLGVAVLSCRPVLQSGGGSSRYSCSSSSADDAKLSSGSEVDDDNNAGAHAHASDPREDISHHQQQRQRGRRQLQWGAAASTVRAGAGAAADSNDEDDLCQWQGGLNSPLQHQQQQHGVAALRDISNSNGAAHGHHNNHQHVKHKQQQQHDAEISRVAAAAAAGAVHVEQDGRLLVEAEVLQLLLDKIDMLEHQLRQQQQPPDGQLSSSTQQQQQQHFVEQQLRQQLGATQQQLARLQEEHVQYVDRTSNLLVRLQAQMQQLMKQAPGLAAGTAAAAAAAEVQDIEAGHHQPQPAGAWEAVPASSSSSSPQRPPAAAAVPGLRSSAAGSAAGRSPAKAHLKPATAVSVTALQHRPGSAGGSSSAAATPARAPGAAGASSSSRFGSAAAQVAEAAALPSYAEMRQRRSAPDTGALWAGGACFTAAPAPAAAPGPAATTTAAAAAARAFEHDAYLRSILGASSQLPFSRGVPAPIVAPNPAAAAAAALSGNAAAPQQQQQQLRRPGSWCNADQVAPVISARSSAGPEAGLLLAPGLAAETYGALPGLQDVGWGIAGGLPSSAVSRVFTAAGIAEAAELPPQPRVLMSQLAGNVSLMDHLRAAKAAAAAAEGAGLGGAGGMRV